MTFPRVSRSGRHFANVVDVIIYPDLVVARTGNKLLRVACEQALLFGRAKRVSRERASERRSREGQRKARSREACFARQNMRACSQGTTSTYRVPEWVPSYSSLPRSHYENSCEGDYLYPSCQVNFIIQKYVDSLMLRIVLV